MRRTLLLSGLAGVLICAPLTVAVARAEEPSALPGQPGGDPAPDTQQAADALKRNRYKDAIASAKKALQRDKRYAPAMLVMAKAYYALKKYELATSIVELAKQLDPNNAEAYNILGFVALARNDNGTAAADFKKATELKPDYGNAWNSLAAQYLQQKNYDGALEAAEKATSLIPYFDKAWMNLGSAHRGKGNYPEAEKAYRRALELNPNSADVYFNLGILYLDAPKIGDLELKARLQTAMTHLAKYKNLAGVRLAKDDPADTYIDEARKGIEREDKRLQRLEKQKARDAAKKPAPTPAAGEEGGPEAPK